MKSKHIWIVLVMLLMAATLEHARGDVDRVPPSRPLDQFPASVAGYDSVDLPLSDETLEVMGKGIFLDRLYTRPAASAPGAPVRAATTAPVSLFIGYFPTQRTGQTIHSPQHCLPGAGWTFDSSGLLDLPDSEGRPSQVGEYVISNGAAKDEVLYWYRSHGRTIANDWTAKRYPLVDSMLYSRTDAALIRIITPGAPGEDRAAAHDRAVEFAKEITPLLPAYVPN